MRGQIGRKPSALVSRSGVSSTGAGTFICSADTVFSNTSYVVYNWLKKGCDNVNKPPNSKYSEREYVEDAHSYFSLVEFVSAKKAEEHAQEKCNPFVFGVAIPANSIHIGVCICVCVGIIDNDLRLRLLQLSDLFPAFRANYAVFINGVPAVLAKFFPRLQGPAVRTNIISGIKLRPAFLTKHNDRSSLYCCITASSHVFLALQSLTQGKGYIAMVGRESDCKGFSAVYDHIRNRERNNPVFCNQGIDCRIAQVFV